MVTNRTAARFAALTAGVATVGVLGVGSAYAAGSVPAASGTTNPLGSVVTGTTTTVTGTVTGVTSTVASAAKALPKPVQKVVKSAQTTVNSAATTVDSTVATLTGANTTQPGTTGSTGTTPTRTTPGGKPGTAAVAGHHRHSSSLSKSAKATAPRESAAGIAIAHLNHVAPLMTRRVEAAADVAPAISDAPAMQTPNTPANEGLLFGLAHPSALLPEAEHDSKFQIELLMLATVIAGAVGAAHIVVARRRLANGEFAWVPGNAAVSANRTILPGRSAGSF